jgi:ketosteroid isomerase-like protein
VFNEWAPSRQAAICAWRGQSWTFEPRKSLPLRPSVRPPGGGSQFDGIGASAVIRQEVTTPAVWWYTLRFVARLETISPYATGLTMTKFARLMTVFLVLILSLSAVSAVSIEGNSDSSKDQFEKLLATYQERLANKNVDGILELYSADPVFIPEYAPPAVGRVAVRTAYEQVFATLKLNGHFIVHEAEVIGEKAWVRTTSTGRFTIIATGKEADIANSEFFLFKLESGVWKIHRYIFTSSAPPSQNK